MKNNYEIKHNPPPLGTEQIEKHKNFDALLQKFSAEGGLDGALEAGTSSGSQTILKYVGGGLVALIAAISVLYLLRNSGQSSDAFLLPPLGIDVPFEEQEVQPEEGDSIRFRSGAILVVPPNALQDDVGQPLSGSATLAWRELSAPEAQLLAGIAEALNPKGHLQVANIFELKGEQDGQPIQIDPNKPLEFIPAQTSPWPAISARRYDHQSWQGSKQVEMLVPELPEQPNEKQRAAKQAELEKQFPAPPQPLKPAMIGEDMQAFEVDVDENEFPELLPYAQIIWVAPKAKVKDEWFEVNWDQLRVNRKGELDYEFVFEKAEKRIRVEAIPQVPYSQKAMQAYQKALRNYEQALAQRNKQIEEMLEAWDNKLVAAAPSTQAKSYRLWVDEFGLWSIGKVSEQQDLPKQELQFLTLENQSIEIAQIFVANQKRKLFYSLNAKAPYPIDLEYSKIWMIDQQNQLWEMQKVENQKVYVKEIDPQQMLKALKSEVQSIQ